MVTARFALPTWPVPIRTVARRKRNRDLDIAMGIAQLLGMVLLVVLVFPQGRQVLTGIGVILVVVVILIGLLIFGVVLLRRTERSTLFLNVPPTTLAAEQSLAQPSKLPVAPARSEPARPSTTTDLVAQLRKIDWFQFEKIVALIFRKRGYTVTRRGGANSDGGIDLVIEKDGQRAGIQCKQWKTWNVGVKAVREFLGALTDASISKGIFITLCGYSSDAKQLAEKHGIEIVNETGLAKMIEQTDTRFDPDALAILRDTQKFCPKCEAEMVLRTSAKGLSAGRRFWGCSTYPRCRFTLSA